MNADEGTAPEAIALALPLEDASDDDPSEDDDVKSIERFRLVGDGGEVPPDCFRCPRINRILRGAADGDSGGSIDGFMEDERDGDGSLREST